MDVNVSKNRWTINISVDIIYEDLVLSNASFPNLRFYISGYYFIP